jgi:hypothetical protein
MSGPGGYHLGASRAARDEAMARVLANSGKWAARAQELLSRLCAHGRPEDRFIGEDLRRVMSPEIGEPPNHPNAWSAMCGTAVKHEVIIAVGRHGPMTKISSHGRKTMIYRWGMPWVEPPRKARKKKGDRIQ